MTKVNFTIYYPHNLYFLMDNLSEWDIHCRSFFRQEFPGLFLSIKNLLPSYRKLRKKYGWEKKNLERFFLESEMKKVKNNLVKIPNEEQKIILKILDILDKKFKVYWPEKERVLKQKTKALKGYWKKYSQQAIREIEQFLDLKIPEQIEIFVLYTPRGTGGGANLGKRGLTLEIGDSRTPLIISFELLLHELIHFAEIVNRKETEKELKKLGLRDKGIIPETLLAKEAIVNLLCPHGILSEKLKIGKFLIQEYRGDKYQEELFKYQKLLQYLVGSYFRNKKQLNYWNDFLPEIAKLIKKNRG